MSVNESTMCRVAKKLHNINPNVHIDDPQVIENLLNKWWDDMIENDWIAMDMKDEEMDAALNDWVCRRFKLL